MGMAGLATVVARPKVVIVGPPAVGKTALCQMFQSGGQRAPNPKVYNMTCGVEFSVKAVTVPGTEEAVEFHCFDTAGQDVYEEMMPQFWEGAKAVVLVYDVTRAFTLEACGHWYGRLLEALGGLESLPGVLVANKVDLRERTVVNRQQGQAMAESLRMPHFEASALEGIECDAPFVELAKMFHGGGGE